MNIFAYCTYAICTGLSFAYGSHDIAFSLLLVLVTLDTISGSIKSFALGKWMSRGMSIGVFVKIIVYLGGPIVTHTFVTNYLGYDIQNVDNILAGILTVFVIAESISIAQNLIVAQTKDESYSETDTITHLLSLAKKSLAYLFYSLISNLENSLEDKKTTKKI